MDKRTTVKIHGKEYEIVGSRVHRFRKDHPDWSIQSEILSQIAGEIIVRASIADEKNIIRATGIAHEKESASSINKTSYVECAETSAIGRALACFDYQGGEFASADEVAQAIHQQSQPAYKNPELVQPPQPEQKPAQVDKNIISEPQRKRLYAIGKSNGWKDEEMKELVKTFGYEHSKDIKRDDYNKICEMLENGIPDVPSGEEPNHVEKFEKEMETATEKLTSKVTEPATTLETKALELKSKMFELTGGDAEFAWELNQMFKVDNVADLNGEQLAEFVTFLANRVIKLQKGE